MASPFDCRSGHIPLSRKPPCPGTGRLARASALLLMHRQRSITICDGQHTPCSNAMSVECVAVIQKRIEPGSQQPEPVPQQALPIPGTRQPAAAPKKAQDRIEPGS